MLPRPVLAAAALVAVGLVASCSSSRPLEPAPARADAYAPEVSFDEDARHRPSGEVRVAAADLALPDPGLAVARRLAGDARRRPRLPALLARPDGPALVALPLSSMRVTTTLLATRARVLVECTFENPHPRTLQGTFTLELPDGASPSDAGMYLDDGPASRGDLSPGDLLPPPLPFASIDPKTALPQRWGEATTSVVEWGTLRPARVIETTSAARAFEAITNGRVQPRVDEPPRTDPLLLEWSVGNSFRTRIFPIPAFGRKRVFFTYDQAPELVGERAVLSLPVPAPLPPAFRLEVGVSPDAYDDAALLLGAARPRPLVGSALLEASALPQDGACVLTARPRAASTQAGFDVDPRLGSVLVHARVRPAAPAPTLARDRPTGQAVFLLDTSLSTRSALATSFERLLAAILEQDDTLERFQVLTFDVAARPLFDGWRENDAAGRARTRAEVGALWLAGATDVGAALAQLDRTLDAPAETTVFLLSDAHVTWGEDDVEALAAASPRLRDARLVGYRVGESSVGRGLLERLTRANGGRVVDVVDAQDVEQAALAHRASPTRITGVRVEGPLDARDVVVRGDPRALHAGQSIEVAFRAPADQDPRRAVIVVETERGAQRFSLEHASPQDPLAARAWAEVVTERLLERRAPPADRVALALSQRFGLCNRVASLLILETDADYVINELSEEALDLTQLSAEPVAEAVVEPEVTPRAEPQATLLERLAARPLPPWTRSPRAPARASAGAETSADPLAGPPLDPVDVHRRYDAWADAGRGGDALRLVSSLVEERPRDPQTLRLVGFALLARGHDEAAAAVFARVVALRPGEPQALFCQALALEALGRADDAVRCYERSPSMTSGRVLYARLLARIARHADRHGDAALALAARTRAAQLGPSEGRHHAFLFWNLDDTDVDLSVREATPAREEVSFKVPRSRSGGRLLGDVQAGLGPEVWVHPSAAPAEVAVDYFASRAAEGTVPAAALLVCFADDEVLVRSAVLPDQRSRAVLYAEGAAGP